VESIVAAGSKSQRSDAVKRENARRIAVIVDKMEIGLFAQMLQARTRESGRGVSVDLGPLALLPRVPLPTPGTASGLKEGTGLDLSCFPKNRT
jgi:hypothetical protein